MSEHIPTVVFVGGGPRTAGLLERLGANAPHLLDTHLQVHVVEPSTPARAEFGGTARNPA